MADAFPDRSMELREKIAWMVESNGWALVPVPARTDLDPPIPGYAYTVGFESSYSFPEVVVFGLTPPAARGLLGLVVEFLEQGSELPVNALFVGLLDNGLRSAFLPVDLDEFGDLFADATEWHRGAGYRMVQLAWPDRNGWMPWEHGFDHRLLLAQPVIGTLEGVSV
jgi:hypothetical protein